ncbi:MAG: response regulator [Acidobacteria bacterium]|nr:response regulator [Acidobacteriota bacterium]MBK8812390.1 response regulator [Acidobacteriota bacterium]
MATSNKKRILLAEDDSSMRRFIAIILTKAGYAVDLAEDGLVAMELINKNVFDAVVADAIMPNLSGYELCRLIQARPESRPLPCVILSGLEENANDGRFSDAFLTKDTNLQETLLRTLERLIGNEKID